jgi:hypothetical protein
MRPKGKKEVFPTELDDYIKKLIFSFKNTQNQPMDIKAVERNILEYTSALNNSANHKDGFIAKELDNNRLTHSGAGKSNGINMKQYSKNKELLENTVIVSAEDLRKSLTTVTGGDKAKNIKNLRSQLEMFYKDDQKILNFIRDESTTEEQLIDQVIKAVSITGNKKKTLGVQIHRFPSLDGLDVNFSKLRVNPNQGKGKIKTGIGLAEKMNDDNDGDTLQWTLPLLSQDYDSQEQFEAVQRGFEQLEKEDTKIAKVSGLFAMENYNKSVNDVRSGKSKKKQEALEQTINEIINEQTQKSLKITGMTAKTNKKKIGHFSNFSTIVLL